MSGILTLQGKDKLQKAVHTIYENNTEDVWLGTTSNRAASVEPKWLLNQSLGHVLCLCVVNSS